jgi:hypothetical protein
MVLVVRKLSGCWLPIGDGRVRVAGYGAPVTYSEKEV